DPLARPDPIHRADALLPRLVLQLPARRPLGRLPIGRAERRDDARQLLLDGPFPLHDHGRTRLHLLRRDLLLGAEDDRLAAERDPGENPLLDDVRLLQLDVRAALRDRLPQPAAPRERLCAHPPIPQRLGLGLRVLPWDLDADLPLQPRLVACLCEEACRSEPVGVAVDRVPAPVAGAGAQLRPYPGVLERPLRLRRGSGTAVGPRGRPGGEGLTWRALT